MGRGETFVIVAKKTTLFVNGFFIMPLEYQLSVGPYGRREIELVLTKL
jgi:hypothetical protein